MFKKGDIVERIEGEWNGMKIGDVAKVVDYKFGSLHFTEYTGGHDAINFKKVRNKIAYLLDEL